MIRKKKSEDKYRKALEDLKKMLKPLPMARDINTYVNRERRAYEFIQGVLDET